MENCISEIRLLSASEIECRISVINEKGLSLLLYKDARVDQKILDETFGMFGWKRSHQCIDGNLYCTVEIYDKEKDIWVAKQDVGTTGYTEKEKSQASDSFKRACFNWGIGRELYSAPFIWVSAGKADIWKNKDRYVCNDRFGVSSIEYNSSREISGLVIKNDKGSIVYELKATDISGRQDDQQADRKRRAAASTPQTADRPHSAITKPQMDGLRAELKRTGVSMEEVKDRYEIQNPERMPQDLYRRVMMALSKTKSA